MAKKESGWVDVFWGIVCLLLAGGSYIMFSKLEAGEEGPRRMPAIILVAYKTLGKTGTAAVFGGIGGLLILYGVKKVVSPAPEEEDTAPVAPNQDTP